MKKNFYLGFIALTALTVTSCSNDDVVMQSPDVNKAIEFGTYLGRDAQSRANVLDITGLEEKGFGVFAFYTGQDAWADANPANETATSTPNFMFNEEVTYNSSAWEYSPIKYWPEKKQDKISFFAYGPYKNNDATPAATIQPQGKGDVIANAVAGAPTVKFTQSIDPALMVDFVTGVAMDQTYTVENGAQDESKTVNFKLKHELTRVNFVAKLDREAFSSSSDENKTKINITSVKIDAGGKFYNNADYTFATKNDESNKDYRGTWSNHQATTADFNLANILNSAAATDMGGYTKNGVLLGDDQTEVPLFKPEITAAESTAAQAAEYLFLIPPVQSDGTTGLAEGDKITVTFTYDIVTVDSNLSAGHSKTTATKVITLPTGVKADTNTETKPNTLQQGKAYKFIFTFGLHEIKVNAQVDAWQTDEAEGGNTEIDWDTDEPTTGESN